MPERRPSTLVIALEHRLNADAAAQLLRNIELLGRPYERLRTHFGSLRFLARGDGATPSTSGDVALVRLPDFRGVAGALQHSFRTFRVSWHALDDANLLLIPVPGFASLPVWFVARIRGVPWIAHVVGDAREVPGSIGLSFGRFWGWLVQAVARAQVRRAVGVWFVTESILQQGYRPHPLALAASNVMLDEEWYQPPRDRTPGQPCRLIFVGSLDRSYKGLDVLLAALDTLRAAGRDWHLDIVGHGAMRTHYANDAEARGLGSRVTWHGHVRRDEVHELLCGADVFVMPSRTEGMPRALLEAMACGLACVATAVGGIVELLAPRSLVPPGNADELASVLMALIEDEPRRRAWAERDFARARDFDRNTLGRRIDVFVQQVLARLEPAR